MSKLYLVTGGTGFLGQHLVRQLLKEDGARVRIFSRSKDRALERAGAEFVKGSVLKPKDLTAAMEGVDGVFHLAGKVERDPRRAHTLFTLHVTGTRNVLEAAVEAKVGRVVVASTSGTVGVTRSGRTIPNDDAEHVTDLVKDWPYYLSKVYAEKTALSKASRADVDVILMRPTLLLGPGDDRLSSTKDVLNYLDGAIPFIPTGGLSFVDVRDTATAFRAAMERGTPGATYLLGSANLTFEAFFERLESISGVPRPRVSVPNKAARFGARLMDAAMKFAGRDPDIDPISVEMSQHFWYIDWSKAMRELDFQPRDPGQTLYDTVQWLKANRPVSPDDDYDPAPAPDANSPFAPGRAWDADVRHAAYSKSNSDAYGAPTGPDAPQTAIPYQGQSRLSYDTYDTSGPGLESLVSGALKGAAGTVGTLINKATESMGNAASSAPAPPSSFGGPSGPSSASRNELDDLLATASPEEVETILRLVRRMKQ